MVVRVLLILGTVAVASTELVLLNRQRYLFRAQGQPRGHFFERRQPREASQLYLRARRALTELWHTVRTAPFTRQPVAAASAVTRTAEGGDEVPAGAEGASRPSNEERRLKYHAARNVLHWISVVEQAELSSPSLTETAGTGPAHAVASVDMLRNHARAVGAGDVASAPVGEGIVYVDASGRVTFANAAARALLNWNGGDLALGEVLSGGPQEAQALLENVARHELIEREVTLLTGTPPTRLDISALALRDRDGNLWGSALFMRRASGVRQQS